MKIIIFIIIFTPLLSQDKRLTMPEGFTKLDILVETPRALFSTSEIESFVKLKLRRNNVEYFADSDDASHYHPMLYINLNIGLSGDDLYFGRLSVALDRGPLYQLSIVDMYKSDFDIIKYTKLKGREGFFGAKVKTYSGIFIKSSPAREYIKDTLDDYLDEFISDYIDANNL